MKTLLLLVSFALVGCQIADADVPKFAAPCKDGCANGFTCDEALDACVPTVAEGEGEGEEQPGRVLAFTVTPTNVAPGESVLVSWTTEHASGCSLEPGIGSVEPNAEHTEVMDQSPGDYGFQLTCIGEDGLSVSSALINAHVRRVHEGNLQLGSQADVNAAAGVEEVTGNVNATASIIGDLSPLAPLTIVRGDILFDGVTGLATLTLPALTTVEGQLRVVFADEALTSIELGALTTVGEHLTFMSLPTVASVNVNGLVSVGGNLTIGGYEYPSFPNVDAYSGGGLEQLTSLQIANLQTIGGWLDAESDFSLPSFVLPSLVSVGSGIYLYAVNATLVSLPLLETTGSGILITHCDALATVSFPALRTTGAVGDRLAQVFELIYANLYEPGFYDAGDIRFITNSATGEFGDPYDNTAIRNIDLSALEAVESGLYFDGIDVDAPHIDLGALTTAGALSSNFTDPISLPALQTIGLGGIHTTYADDRLIGLQNLTTVEGDFGVFDSAMPDLVALTRIGGQLQPALQRVGGRMVMRLAALAALEEVGTLMLTTGGLTSFAELSALTTIGSLRVSSSELTSLGLGGVTTITGSIDDNPNAISIQLNAELTSATLPLLVGDVPGAVNIADNTTLATIDFGGMVSVDALSIQGASLASTSACALTTVDGALDVFGTALASLDGFDALTSAGSITVTNNAVLPACFVDQLNGVAATLINTNNSGTDPVPCDDLGPPVCL
jgi:hypothetical protein